MCLLHPSKEIKRIFLVIKVQNLVNFKCLQHFRFVELLLKSRNTFLFSQFLGRYTIFQPSTIFLFGDGNLFLEAAGGLKETYSHNIPIYM